MLLTSILHFQMASRSFNPILNTGSKKLSKLAVRHTCPKPQLEMVRASSCTTTMKKLDQFSHDQEKYFYKLKPFKSIYAELQTEYPKEIYDIFTKDLENSLDHTFSHAISVAHIEQVEELRQFMLSTHPGTNPRWIDVALRNGDKCVTVRLGDEIAGVGWLSLVNGIGRLHSLFVKPRFRKIGVGLDILFARLLWLKSKHARIALSEISVNNLQSSGISVRGGMKVSGQVYQYFRTETGKPRD